MNATPFLLISTTLLAAAETAKTAESSGLPQMDVSTFPSQLFWLFVTFAVLFWRMSSDILPRLGGIIEERKDRIADDLDQAADFKQQAEEAQTSYEKALSDAKAKARGIAADTRDAIDREIAEMQADMETELAAKLDAAESRIADMKASATAKVEEAAVETTRAVIETLLDEVPTNEAVQTAVANASPSS